MIGISVKTLENWKNHGTIDRRKGASKEVPRKLSEQEKQKILEVCNSERFKDMTLSAPNSANSCPGGPLLRL
jgi:transposase